VGDEHELGPGSKIGRYEVVRSVARGGMGHVWLGRLSGMHGFEKLVAIKTIRPDLASDAQLRTMLLDEAGICSRIQHANVAQILDVGEHDGLPYVVFEWVEGASLEELFRAAEGREERAAVAPLLRVMAWVCEGLHAAHELKDERGELLKVVHRDVSPSNVIVGRSGYAKLIDFGVARARDRIAGETRSGIVKGTPQYMAPEQAQGAKVDRRADVWAVGAVMHRGLSGSPPFRDRFALERYIHRRSEPDPLPEEVPAEVREIVARAMRRDPAERFPTAADMGFAIERVLRAEDARPDIGELFSSESGPAKGPAEQPTERAGDLAFAATQPLAEGVGPKPPKDAEAEVPATKVLSPRVAPAPSRAIQAPSRAIRIAFAVAIAAAALGLGALVWALVST
jgi:serine/threonine-protein kinase